MPASLDNLSRIFTPSPVNRDHPLNRGRVGWWLCLPGMTGGRQFFDLMGRNHGTLTSMGNTNNGWRSSFRPGGRNHIITDGAAGYIDCGTPLGLNGASQGTLGGWIYKANSSMTAGFGGTAGSNNNRFSLIWFSDDSFYFATENTDNCFGFFSLGSSGWHHAHVVFDGTLLGNANRVKCYIDGVQRSVSFNGTPPSTIGNVAPFCIGRDSVGRVCGGAYDDISLWLRPLTAAEVQQDYILSRKGYPDVLNRLSTRVYSVPATLVTYTLTAGTATVALTSGTTTLKAARIIAPSAASFGLTTNAATTTKALRIAVPAASFALTSQTAALLPAHAIVPVTATYTIASQAVTLQLARVLVTGTATYSHTPQTATLLAARKITPAPSTLALTCNTAPLVAARRHSPATSAFALTSQAVSLLHAYRISPATGNFVITPKAVTLTKHSAGGGLLLLRRRRFAS